MSSKKKGAGTWKKKLEEELIDDQLFERCPKPTKVKQPADPLLPAATTASAISHAAAAYFCCIILHSFPGGCF